MTVTTETIRRIYEDASGAFIEVKPDSDALNLVVIETPTEDCQAEFGRCHLTLNSDIALQLSEALKHAAKEAMAQERKDYAVL